MKVIFTCYVHLSKALRPPGEGQLRNREGDQETRDQINTELKNDPETELGTEFENDPETKVGTEDQNDLEAELRTEFKNDPETELGTEDQNMTQEPSSELSSRMTRTPRSRVS